MQKVNVQEVLAQITKKDPRYDRDAYIFVRESLDHTLKLLKKVERGDVPKLVRGTTEEPKKPATHVSGQELLQGIRDLALQQYGPLARTVLEHWGVRRCDDFGEIVFNMVEIGLLGKTDKDSKADFAGGYDFEEAFVKPFRPGIATEAGLPPRSPEPDRSKN